MPRAEVDDRYLDTPYYVAPADQVAQEAFGEQGGPRPSNVINLMDALRRSIAAEKAEAATSGTPGAQPAEAPPK